MISKEELMKEKTVVCKFEEGEIRVRLLSIKESEKLDELTTSKLVDFVQYSLVEPSLTIDEVKEIDSLSFKKLQDVIFIANGVKLEGTSVEKKD